MRRFPTSDVSSGLCSAALRGVLGAVLVLWVAGATAQASPVSDRQAQRWVDRDAVTLGRAADVLVARHLAQPFARIEDRVPAYSDWVYGWLSSIVVSVRLLGVGVQSVGDQVWRNGSVSSDATVRDLEQFVADAFEQQVIAPDAAGRDLAVAWIDAVGQLHRLDRRLAAARAARGAPPAYAGPLLAGWDPGEPPRLRRGPQAVLRDHAAEDPAHADLVLRRSVRPLSIRALSAATRLVIVPVIIPLSGGAAAIPLLDVGGFVGNTVISGVIAAGLWGTDYLINWVDSAWNRPGFEAELRAVVRAQRTRTIADGQRHLAAGLCARIPATC